MANASRQDGSSNTIKVVARFRPQNKIELASGGEPIVNFQSEDTCELTSKEASGHFTFDRVFDMESRQSDVFEFSIKSTVEDILHGYNGTVFAYGQTGAGKSYTMMGSDIDDDQGKGIIPRIVEQIFASIMSSSNNIEYTVRVSYMEIYMERIRDLLQPQNDNLPIHEEKARGVYVKGMMEIYVTSVREVYDVMKQGGLARAVAATNMNQESSRSHSIFVVTITQKNIETGSAKSGQLFLVDLAGSEKVGKTGASGQTLEEAKKINKSLSALGNVINSLTDGKSQHIPYRDSKLTRILQESLGGNSRTTLIINCSPSSYNDSETLSTLRFGVRAKAIKNKAKINAELSPIELKALLKKAQGQVTTYESYIASLEGEVGQWRNGDTVPKERWTISSTSGSFSKSEASTRKLETPRLISDAVRLDSPSRPESRAADRSSTPSLVLEKDERDEFLRRENELQDQLSERESQIATAERALLQIREEISVFRNQQGRSGREAEIVANEANELRMQLEKVAFEGKEDKITMDSLKEQNTEMASELDDIKRQLVSVRMQARENDAALDEKEKNKAERMAKMMAGFDLGSEVFSENEALVKEMVAQVDRLSEISNAGDVILPEELGDLRSRLLKTQGIVRQAELANSGPQSSRKAFTERSPNRGPTSDASSSVEDLQDAMSRQSEENAKLKASLQNMQQKPRPQTNGSYTMLTSKTIQQQIAEFDVMKKSLMRDLQNRCERVVELEISLDETREQYNNVLKTSNNKTQQRKMAFLERNLEQITHVQRQLVEQNGSLKKEVAIAERKLVARNERIISLERLLADSQEKLMAANHKYVDKDRACYSIKLTKISTDLKRSLQQSKRDSKLQRWVRPDYKTVRTHRHLGAGYSAQGSPSL